MLQNKSSYKIWFRFAGKVHFGKYTLPADTHHNEDAMKDAISIAEEIHTNEIEIIDFQEIG